MIRSLSGGQRGRPETHRTIAEQTLRLLAVITTAAKVAEAVRACR